MDRNHNSNRGLDYTILTIKNLIELILRQDLTRGHLPQGNQLQRNLNMKLLTSIQSFGCSIRYKYDLSLSTKAVRESEAGGSSER